MISQFFVVSPRGDTLIFKDYRGDVSRNTSEKFWRHVKFSKGAAEPVFVSQALPAEWRGTTFRNSALLGREGFARRLIVTPQPCAPPCATVYPPFQSPRCLGARLEGERRRFEQSARCRREGGKHVRRRRVLVVRFEEVPK